MEDDDQVLDSVLVGPVLQGNYKFVFEGNAPDASKIPTDDVIGESLGPSVAMPCHVQRNKLLALGIRPVKPFCVSCLSHPLLPFLKTFSLLCHP